MIPTPPSGGQRVLAIAAFLAIYMQGVNISIPNAALPHMQGTLSMADDEIGWIFTAYVTASLVTLPLTRWLAGRFGRRAVLLGSLLLFSLGLVLDAQAGTCGQLILARVLQGAASGPLGPLALAILLDLTPLAHHARVGLASTACALFGISSGPPIGGWLSEYHGWPSIFHASLPLAGFVFLVMALWLPEKRAQQSPPFDFFGLAAFSLGIVGLQLLLDRGERLEWFASPEIWAEAAAAALGFSLFIIHILTARAHFLDKALFRDRNFVLSTLIAFAAGFVLLPTLALTSPMLEELFAYPVDTTGYMAVPRGVALVGMLILAGRVPARIDSRALVVGGTALVVYANWRMLGYSPAMDWWPVVLAGTLQGAGLGLLLPALGRVAFSTLDRAAHPEGAVLFNLSRLYGSTIGIAVVQIFFYGNTQAMHLALARNLTPYRAAAHGVASAPGPALALINELVTGQAATVAIIGQFKILMLVMLAAAPLTLFLRAPRPGNR
ncbi:Efflux pump protein [Nitrospirillum viridazoti Y2]|uniref:DHA2 family multidrug resistance protein n=1 Tax=Nitrospirillum amazonense TaxID=28077 RepID=A0A560IQC0_9PROT|nr:DHA2 family efflux MFS transporter permease subunit [Nitrospirillum amazonense]EGX99495.1 Efflux pump protein [Nitrospirillum amazonense Y2]TWB60661.1 DHA2 family multidrug resistance protein [Nitrospirillum amazonense]